MHTELYLDNLKGKDHVWDPGTDKRTAKNWILNKQGIKAWSGFTLLRMEPNGELCKHGINLCIT